MGKFAEKFSIFTFLFEDEYGKVYRGWNKEEKRVVWIKIIHEYLTKDENYRKDLLLKADLARDLNHDNIQELYDFWGEDGLVFLELENLRGTFMDEILFHRKKLSEIEIISISYQLFSALNYAHMHGICHENVRPHHIVISKTGVLKITNFMMPNPLTTFLLAKNAKVYKDENIEFHKLIRFASRWHMDYGKALDWYADVFSAGVTIYELATNESPWDTSSIGRFLYTMDAAKAIPIWKRNNKLPMVFSHYLMKCFQEYPCEEYHTSQIFAVTRDAYEKYAKPVLEAEEAKKKKKVKLQKFLTYTVAIILVIGLFLFPSGRANLVENNPIHLAILPVESKSESSELNPLLHGLMEELSQEISFTNPFCVKPLPFFTRSDFMEKAKMSKVDLILKAEIEKDREPKLSTSLYKVKGERADIIMTSKFNIHDLTSLRFYLGKEIIEALKIDFNANPLSLNLNKKINPDAYKLYINSLYWHSIFLKDPKKEYIEISDSSLLKALDLEQGFAPIYAGLAANALFKLEYGIENDLSLLEFSRKMCEKSLQLDKKQSRARSILAVLYKKENKKEKAYKELKEIFIKNPQNLMATGALGSLYQYSGLLDRALEKYKRLKKSYPMYAITSINMGRIYLHQQKLSKAEKEFRNIVRESEHPYATSYLGLTLLYRGKNAEAEKVLEKAIEKHPEAKFIKLPLAMVYLKENKLQKAEEAIKSVIETAKSDEDLSYRVATYYALKNDKASALKWLKIAVQNGNENYILFKNDPYLKNLKGDKEFKDLMKEVKNKWEKYKKEFTL